MDNETLDKAKDKIINHLSHELRTPLSVIAASISLVEKRFLEKLPDQDKEGCFEILKRAKRNLQRLLNMQYQIEDIVKKKNYNTFHLLNNLVYACTDQLETFITEEMGGGEVIKRIRRRIDEIFGPRESKSEKISLDAFVSAVLKNIGFRFAHREGRIIKKFEPVPKIYIPQDVLFKIVEGLVKNALENTPDKGEIIVSVKEKRENIELTVKDFGIGISEENQKMIFQNYFTTYETMGYSSKREYDFGAGGKGFDLLRLKIFSDQYGFSIHMKSDRCRFIKETGIACPGNIDKCEFCKKPLDCFESGGTTMTIIFDKAE